MREFKRNCYHCVYIRPRKSNLCVISKKKINDIQTFICDNYKIDTVIQRIEEAMDKKDDDGSKRLIYWLFSFVYSPFKFDLI